MSDTVFDGRWDAASFFETLTAANKLAQQEQFCFCRVSGLEGFEEAVNNAQTASNFVCVSDISDGYTELNNTPRTRRVKTIFFAMRHAAEDMTARAECMETMRELFRQFMSRLLQEKVRLEQKCIYLDPRITFNEIDRYFFTGAAGAYFQIAVDCYTDLSHNAAEWDDDFDPESDAYVKYDLYMTRGFTTLEQKQAFCSDPLLISEHEVLRACLAYEDRSDYDRHNTYSGVRYDGNSFDLMPFIEGWVIPYFPVKINVKPLSLKQVDTIVSKLEDLGYQSENFLKFKAGDKSFFDDCFLVYAHDNAFSTSNQNKGSYKLLDTYKPDGPLAGKIGTFTWYDHREDYAVFKNEHYIIAAHFVRGKEEATAIMNKFKAFTSYVKMLSYAERFPT